MAQKTESKKLNARINQNRTWKKKCHIQKALRALNIYYQDFRSILGRGKTQGFINNVYTIATEHDTTLLNETWFDSTINENDFNLMSYKTYRCDRKCIENEKS